MVKKRGWRPSPPFFALIILILAAGTLALGKASHNSAEGEGKYWLVIASTSGTERMAFPVEEGDGFTIKYIHSVDLLPVYEDYQVLGSDGFVLRQTRQHTFGAGLGDWQGELKFEDGLQVIKNIDKIFIEQYLRVGRIADHTLVLAGTETPVSQVFQGGELVVVYVEERH